MPPHDVALNVEVSHIERVLLDEFAAWFDLIAQLYQLKKCFKAGRREVRIVGDCLADADAAHDYE